MSLEEPDPPHGKDTEEEKRRRVAELLNPRECYGWLDVGVFTGHVQFGQSRGRVGMGERCEQVCTHFPVVQMRL